MTNWESLFVTCRLLHVFYLRVVILKYINNLTCCAAWLWNINIQLRGRDKPKNVFLSFSSKNISSFKAEPFKLCTICPKHNNILSFIKYGDGFNNLVGPLFRLGGAVGSAAACGAGDSGSNPGSGEDFSLKLI